MRKRAWLMWSMVAVVLLSLLMVVACIPVLLAWRDRWPDRMIVSLRNEFPKGTVGVRYLWIMQKADFIYRPLVKLNAAIHGFEGIGTEQRDSDGVILMEFYSPREEPTPP